MTAKVLIGIDAGFANAGVTAFLVSKGKLRLINAAVITTEQDERKKEMRKSDDDIERLKKMTTDMDEFIKSVDILLNRKFGVNKIKHFIAAEFPTGGAQGSRANRCMGMATGQLVSYLIVTGIPFEQVTPAQVKSIVKNKKSVSKDDVIQAVVKYASNQKMCSFNLVQDKRTKMINIGGTLTNEVIPMTYSLFEHAADSISAVKYVKDNSQLYKLFAGV